MESNVAITSTEDVKPKMHFSGKVLKISLAGALVDIGVEQPAAIHVSQIVGNSDEQIKRVEDVLSVGQEIDVWVKRVKEGRIELTMLKPLDLEWRDIKKDMVVKGKVVRMEKFGAFVEIGAERPGLIHISEMAHGYVHSPSDVMKDGDEIEAMVLEVNRRKKQIKLSIKALQPAVEEILKEVDEEEQEAPKAEIKRGKDKGPRRKKGSRSKDEDNYRNESGDILITDEDETEFETAMGIALREAMERSKKSRKSQADDSRAKKTKSLSHEQENILNRTLEQKPTS